MDIYVDLRKNRGTGIFIKMLAMYRFGGFKHLD